MMEKKIKWTICFVTILCVFCLFSTLFAEGTGTIASKELFEKFRAVSEEVCRNAVTLAATLGTGTNNMKEEEKKELEEMLEDMVKQENSELMTKYQSAFLLNDSEAKKILLGEFDNEKNKETIANCKNEFKKIMVILPVYIAFLISEYDKDSLSDLELEFASRLLKEFLKQTYDKVKSL